MWIRLFKDSQGDGGTLQQLKHLINRTNVPINPKKNVNAAEDFIRIVTLGHVIAAALTHFKMSTQNDDPKSELLKALKVSRSEEERKQLFHKAVADMLKKNLLLSTLDSPNTSESTDKVQTYAQETLSLGLLLAEFEDAIKEGDGRRVLRCWKFFLLIFKSARRTNYALEAFTLLSQYHVLFPQRLREQLLWSRFVNTQGKPSCNIPADLQNEHLNRTAKMALGGQASNLKPKTIDRTGKILGPLVSICGKFDDATQLHRATSGHSLRSFKKDLDKITTELVERSKVFQAKPLRRQHHKFPNLHAHIITPLKDKKEEVITWMKDQLARFYV